MRRNERARGVAGGIVQACCVVVLGAAVGLGCGDRARDSVSASAGGDACAVMPLKLAERALGLSLRSGQEQAFGTNPRQREISSCLYLDASPSGKGMVTLTIRRDDKPGPAGAAERLVGTIKQEFGQRYEVQIVPGLFDGAVWDPSLRQLSVVRGRHTYAWLVSGTSPDGLKEKLMRLAGESLAVH